MMAKQAGRSSWYSAGIGRGLTLSVQFFKFKSQMSAQIMINRIVIHPVYTLLTAAMVCVSRVVEEAGSTYNKEEWLQHTLLTGPTLKSIFLVINSVSSFLQRKSKPTINIQIQV